MIDSMKNVLVLTTTFPRWENDPEPGFVYSLSKLLGRDYNVSVLVPHFFRAKKFEKKENLNIYRFSYFPEKFQKVCYDGGILSNMKKSFLAKIGFPFLVFFEFFNVLILVKKKKIDIIHAHWILHHGLIAAIIKKIYGIPFIVSSHGGDIFPFKDNWFFKMFIRFVLRNCDYCTTNSSVTKEAVLSVLEINDIEIIPMGVDLNEFSETKRDNSLKKELNINGEFLLSVGRIVEQKGINYLINAMPEILNDFSNAKLIIVGDGNEKENLEKLTKKLKLENNIIFTGKLPNNKLPRYYATADVFIAPSIKDSYGWVEAMGIVFLESLSSGTPIIGSNIGGIPDIIRDNETGLLVEQKNSKEIAIAVKKILKDKNFARKLVKNGQNFIKTNYSWDSVSYRFKKVYSVILAK